MVVYKVYYGIKQQVNVKTEPGLPNGNWGKAITRNLGWVTYVIWEMDLPLIFLEIKG